VQAPEKSEGGPAQHQVASQEFSVKERGHETPRKRPPDVLMDQARQEDAAHRAANQKPISADTLRVRLGVGAAQARRLVKIVRSEYEERLSETTVEIGLNHNVQSTAATVVA
jgi:hypothetical protein